MPQWDNDWFRDQFLYILQEKRLAWWLLWSLPTTWIQNASAAPPISPLALITLVYSLHFQLPAPLYFCAKGFCCACTRSERELVPNFYPVPSCWKQASTNALVDKFPSLLSPQMGKLWDTGAKYSPQTDVSLGSVHYGCMICTEIESKHLRTSIVISQSSYRSPAPNNKKWLYI